MDLEALDGTSLALLLMSKTETGDDDWAVFSGVLRVREGIGFLDRGKGQSEIELRPEWLARIKPTNQRMRSILLDAAYYLDLRVADLPAGSDKTAFKATGLKWPEP